MSGLACRNEAHMRLPQLQALVALAIIHVCMCVLSKLLHEDLCRQCHGRQQCCVLLRSVKNAHEQLTGCLSQLMPFVYVAFFGLAGASLKLVRVSVMTPKQVAADR